MKNIFFLYFLIDLWDLFRLCVCEVNNLKIFVYFFLSLETHSTFIFFQCVSISTPENEEFQFHWNTRELSRGWICDEIMKKVGNFPPSILPCRWSSVDIELIKFHGIFYVFGGSKEDCDLMNQLKIFKFHFSVNLRQCSVPIAHKRAQKIVT